jgi:hypothetical protein
MDMKLKIVDDVLIAELSGQLTLREALKVCMLACDGATERGFSNFLLDASAVDGELSISSVINSGVPLRTMRLTWLVLQSGAARQRTSDYWLWCPRGLESRVGGNAVSRVEKAMEWLNAFARGRSRPQRNQES